jgi:phage antirepressor YoqD-like protein
MSFFYAIKIFSSNFLTVTKTAEELITNPDLIIEIAQALKTERAKIVEMQPKVEFAERIANYDDKIFDIGETAKILKLSYGRNTLFGYLRELGIMMKNKNIPLQKYIDRGYFQVSIIEIPIGKTIVYKSKIYITGKGLAT